MRTASYTHQAVTEQTSPEVGCQTPLLHRWQYFRIKKEGKGFALLFSICALKTETKAPANYPLAVPPRFHRLQTETTAAALLTCMLQFSPKIHPWDECRPLIYLPKHWHVICRVKSTQFSQLWKNKQEQKKKKNSQVPENSRVYKHSFHKSVHCGSHPKRNITVSQQWWKAMSLKYCICDTCHTTVLVHWEARHNQSDANSGHKQTFFFFSYQMLCLVFTAKILWSCEVNKGGISTVKIREHIYLTKVRANSFK